MHQSFRPALSRSAVMKAAHARVAASRAFLVEMAAKRPGEFAGTLARFDYRRAFADALRFAWAWAKQEAARLVNPGAAEASARAWRECSTDGRLAA